MTSDAALVLAWLVLAHLVADFLLQTGGMVADKFTTGRRAWRGLIAHGAAVALCLTPVAAAYGSRGALLLVVVTVAHVAIDRWKVRATRHAEAVALAGAHRRHETRDDGGGDGLGSAWTPVPGALFLVDQLFHLAVTVAAWIVLIAPLQPLPEWVALVNRALVGVDPAAFHRWTLGAVVVASLVVVNVRAAALFVAVLVRPRESVTGEQGGAGAGAGAAGGGAGAAATGGTAVPGGVGWRVRMGPFVARVDPVAAPASGSVAQGFLPAGAASGSVAPGSAAPGRGDASATARSVAPGSGSGAAPGRAPRDGHASPARIGATIGILERLLIVTFVLTGATAAIGFVIAAKTLARFKQLDDRDFAEYYLLGTLASVAVALGSALLAQAALATVP